jgi:Na+/H+ antiporter NhaD/arsenite permease-like protein
MKNRLSTAAFIPAAAAIRPPLLKNPAICLIAATATSMSAFCSAGAFPDLVDVTQIAVRHGVTAEAHNWISQVCPFIGFNPGFYAAAATDQQH